MSEASGKIQTVLGLVDPDDLGRTLAHEHISLVFDVAYCPPKESDAAKSDAPFVMENLGWIRQNPYSHRSNLKFNDQETMEAVIEEMKRYKELGGGALVECTTHGIQRKAKVLKEISSQTGVHIISGTDFERSVIQATAEVQSNLGCPVSFHPGRNPESPFEIIRIFQEAGGDVNKVAMSHLDRTIFDEGQLSEFAELGSYCEFDLFGVESSYYQLNEAVDMPSDAQRIQRIWQLVDEDFEDKILLSHDIHTKHRLSKFGGHGYSHIFENVIPKMSNRGLSSQTVNKFLVDNPKAWLTFK